MMMTKHAYLIISHNEFGVLNKLVQCLDEEWNDIYIHFDRKVPELPIITCKNSNLVILENRVDVRWGTYSQIECEMALMKAAFTTGVAYDYYHIISGVHFPLKSQDEIHQFFSQCEGKSVMQLWEVNESEIRAKLSTYHILTRHFMAFNTWQWHISRFIWKAANAAQRIIDVKRNKEIKFYKSDNWVSLSHDAIGCLIGHEDEIKRVFKMTFCGDEWFVATILRKYNMPIMNTNRLLKVEFGRYAPSVYSDEDLDKLINSNCMFARKFSAAEMGIVTKLLSEIQSK